MSLINKMLQDLEAREQSNTSGSQAPYHGLHAAAGYQTKRRSHGRLVFWTLAALTLAGAGYYFGDRYLPKNIIATTPVKSEQIDVAAVPVQPTPVAEAAPAATAEVIP